MKFAFEIGENERHKVDFSFNQLLGVMVIKVNDREVKKRIRLFSEPARETHALLLGNKEALAVRIEKERKLLIGQRYRVFVNDRLLKCVEGL